MTLLMTRVNDKNNTDFYYRITNYDENTGNTQ